MKQPDSNSVVNDTGDNEDFIIYRLQTANEFLKDALLLLKNKSYKTCANRIYYSVYKSLSALHAVDGNTYRKHKATLEFFNKNYIHENKFPQEYGETIYRIQKLRHTSDYEDFKTPSRTELTEHIQFATKLMYEVRKYCQARMKKSIDLTPEKEENEEERSFTR